MDLFDIERRVTRCQKILAMLVDMTDLVYDPSSHSNSMAVYWLVLADELTKNVTDLRDRIDDLVSKYPDN